MKNYKICLLKQVEYYVNKIRFFLQFNFNNNQACQKKKKMTDVLFFCFVLINHTFWWRMKNENSKQCNDHGFNNNNSKQIIVK